MHSRMSEGLAPFGDVLKAAEDRLYRLEREAARLSQSLIDLRVNAAGYRR